MSQRDTDILTSAKSSEIAYFHFFSFLLKDPKQGITAFLKLIFSLSCSDSTSLSPSSGNTAREERRGTVTLRAIFKPFMKAAFLLGSKSLGSELSCSRAFSSQVG